MRYLIIIAIFSFFSSTTGAEPKQRIIELELKPLGEPSSRTLPVVRFPVVEGFSGWIDQKSQLTNYEEFIKLMVKTYSEAKTVSELSKIWDSRSFSEIQKMLSSDSDIFEQNSNYYNEIQDNKILGVVIYGNYEIIFVNHKMSDGDSRERYYPVYFSDEKRVLSNEISNDVFYQYLINKMQSQLIERWSM